MGRRPILLVAGTVVAVAGLSALVAYRLGLRHAADPSRQSAAGRDGCLDIHNAPAHVGETGCVSGRVLRVFISRAGNAFLDFCPDYSSCPFTSVIFSSDRAKFGALESLEGRQVEIRGPITSYQSRAEIKIHDPQQVRAVP